MHLSRRDALRGFAAASVIAGSHGPAPARADGEASSVTLSSGVRVHILPSQSRYVNAALVLRSSKIEAEGGLAHLLEHTSFTGAAGSRSAAEIKDMHRDYIQDSNASTRPGIIEWWASFLPKHLEQVLDLLAITSLEQRFDVETVRAEARIVLQELFLDKYHTRSAQRRRFGRALFGDTHPYGINTTGSEIAKAKTAPPDLAAELREYARMIRLPANMDLFLVGALDRAVACRLAEQTFGRFPFAKGEMLEMPKATRTTAYKAVTMQSPELRRPLSEVRIAWNTGVGITHPDATALIALSEYLDDMLFSEVRERYGEAYSPEASYDPNDGCGTFEITIPSTETPDRIERRIFEGVDKLKSNIHPRELARFRDRLELERRKTAESNNAQLECMVDRVVQGGSVHDLNLEELTRDEILAAARKYLPSHKGAYVRLSLLGR